MRFNWLVNLLYIIPARFLRIFRHDVAIFPQSRRGDLLIELQVWYSNHKFCPPFSRIS